MERLVNCILPTYVYNEFSSTSLLSKKCSGKIKIQCFRLHPQLNAMHYPNDYSKLLQYGDYATTIFMTTVIPCPYWWYP